MADTLLQLHEITKQFPGVTANDHVSFDLRAGEVHALVGENGAGKTTLMKILYGLLDADRGQIRVNGEPVRLHSPRDAIERGIGMAYVPLELSRNGSHFGVRAGAAELEATVVPRPFNREALHGKPRKTQPSEG